VDERASGAEGAALPVRAAAGARSNQILGWHAGELKVAVTQIAERGKANQAIIELLARRLKLRRSQIVLRSGPTASRKVFLVRDITSDDLNARIQAALDA